MSKAHVFFKENSFNDCSLAALMSHIDLTTGSFYKAFSNKNQIMHIILEKVLFDFTYESEKIIHKKTSVEKKFKEFISLILSDDGILGNELIKTAYFLSQSDSTIQIHINLLYKQLSKSCMEILYQKDNGGQNNRIDDVLPNYLLGLYFSTPPHNNQTKLNEKIDTLAIKFLKDK
ncbi:TetR/AcrR family transcriptional regulator [Pseudomonas reactans]|nr:TetR/AcrR family transcriptional regulator [Pseudomonas reactans]